MKTLFALITAVSLCSASVLVYGQSVYHVKDVSANNSIQELENMLVDVYRSRPSQSFKRNEVLRINRAVHYLNQAKRHVNFNWDKQAIRDIQRGKKLVNLYKEHLVSGTSSNSADE